MSIPMTIGEESVTMKGTGMVWLAKDGPGLEEFPSLEQGRRLPPGCRPAV